MNDTHRKTTLMSSILRENALAGVRIDDEDFANMMSALQAECGESHRKTRSFIDEIIVKRAEDVRGVLPFLRSIDGATWWGDRPADPACEHVLCNIVGAFRTFPQTDGRLRCAVRYILAEELNTRWLFNAEDSPRG